MLEIWLHANITNTKHQILPESNSSRPRNDKTKDFNFAQSRETFLNGRFEPNARGVKFATAKGEIKRLNAEMRRVMAEQLAIYEWRNGP